MRRIEWHDRLNLGVTNIDEQHQEIINHANILLAALEKGKDTAVIKGLVGNLRKSILDHTSFEERYMKKIGYPDLEMHAAEHKKVREMVNDLQHRLFDRVGVEPAEIRTMLKEYMLGHFLKIDGQLVDFLKENKQLMAQLGRDLKEVEAKKKSAGGETPEAEEPEEQGESQGKENSATQKESAGEETPEAGDAAKQEGTQDKEDEASRDDENSIEKE